GRRPRTGPPGPAPAPGPAADPDVEGAACRGSPSSPPSQRTTRRPAAAPPGGGACVPPYGGIRGAVPSHGRTAEPAAPPLPGAPSPPHACGDGRPARPPRSLERQAMSATSHDTPVSAGRVLTPQFAVVAGGLAGALGAAAYISSFFLLSDLTGREAVRSPLCVTANVLIALGFLTVALALPPAAGPLRLP